MRLTGELVDEGANNVVRLLRNIKDLLCCPAC
eukprot:COSAG06_NODE_50860_length_315_cov_14.402778_2_plen_31_part_01